MFVTTTPRVRALIAPGCATIRRGARLFTARLLGSAALSIIAGCALPHALGPNLSDRDVNVSVPDRTAPIDSPDPSDDMPELIDAPTRPDDIPNGFDVPNLRPDIPNVRDVPNAPVDIPNARPDVPSPQPCGRAGESCCAGAGPGVAADGCRNGVDCWPLTRRCECGAIGQRPCNGNSCSAGATPRDVRGEVFCVSDQGAGAEQNSCRPIDPACNVGLTCRDFGSNFCVRSCGERNQPCCLARFCVNQAPCAPVAGSTYGVCQ